MRSAHLSSRLQQCACVVGGKLAREGGLTGADRCTVMYRILNYRFAFALCQKIDVTGRVTRKVRDRIFSSTRKQTFYPLFFEQLSPKETNSILGQTEHYSRTGVRGPGEEKRRKSNRTTWHKARRSEFLGCCHHRMRALAIGRF